MSVLAAEESRNKECTKALASATASAPTRTPTPTPIPEIDGDVTAASPSIPKSVSFPITLLNVSSILKRGEDKVRSYILKDSVGALTPNKHTVQAVLVALKDQTSDVNVNKHLTINQNLDDIDHLPTSKSELDSHTNMCQPVST